MKIRILENVKTDLAEEAILSVLPEEIDPIGISEIKVENYLVKYFFHKDEIVVTEVKLLPKEVETNSLSKGIDPNYIAEQIDDTIYYLAPKLSDKTLYFMYRKYYNRAFVDYMDGNDKAYIKHKNIANRIKKEILSRCGK